jgi:hypothetical protein
MVMELCYALTVKTFLNLCVYLCLRIYIRMRLSYSFTLSLVRAENRVRKSVTETFKYMIVVT